MNKNGGESIYPKQKV